MKPNTIQTCVGVLSGLAFACCLLLPKNARAEEVLTKVRGWELFSDGRINGFVSYARGDAYPLDGTDVNGNIVALQGGGLTPGEANVEAAEDPASLMPGQAPSQGKIDSMRVKSGFLGNILGFGARRKLTNDGTTLKGYVALWAFIESENREKYKPVYADVREGYLQLQGPWGGVTVGRTLTLFSRGATEITYLYGFQYGLGYPGSVDINGPAAGHIGFGVLANGFAAGVVYATPVLGGLQLSVGAFDPSALRGSLTRTKWLRPEAELTYELPIGDNSMIKVFGNGGWQKVYASGGTQEASAYGAGYGARLEFGPFHLGLAGHYGKGLGLNYALQNSPATTFSPSPPATTEYELRLSDGYYAQAQVAVGKVDLAAGVGITRIYQLDKDKSDNRDDDNDVATPTGNDDGNAGAADPLDHSLIRQQLGMSAGVVYHFTDYLHFDVDYFRANFSWYLGQKQVVNFINAGATMKW